MIISEVVKITTLGKRYKEAGFEILLNNQHPRKSESLEKKKNECHPASIKTKGKERNEQKGWMT